VLVWTSHFGRISHFERVFCKLETLPVTSPFERCSFAYLRCVRLNRPNRPLAASGMCTSIKSDGHTAIAATSRTANPASPLRMNWTNNSRSATGKE
jgi:hypothetical protein